MSSSSSDEEEEGSEGVSSGILVSTYGWRGSGVEALVLYVRVR